MARGVSAASVRHARARLRSQQRAAHANRSVYERGHRGLDEVVRLRVAKNVLPHSSVLRAWMVDRLLPLGHVTTIWTLWIPNLNYLEVFGSIWNS